jgi:hypothetical protein
MNLTYHQEGEYLMPDLIPPESPKIGKLGMQRLEFLRQHRRPIYSGMLMNGTLNSHLEEIDQTADEMLEHLMNQMAQAEGVTETLKAQNQMEWVARMNNIRSRAEEMILNDLIYA